jgi:hypothetical protein
MHQRKKFFKALRNLKSDEIRTKPISSFFSSILDSENLMFNEFVVYSRELFNNIIDFGVTVPIPSYQIKKRERLGLQPLNFDNKEIRKLAELTKLGSVDQ